MSEPIDRRGFMQRAVGAGAAVSMSFAGPLTRSVQGANDRVRVGVIGAGRQGRSNLEAFKKQGAEIAAVCDVYAPNLQLGREAAGEGASTQTDFRRVLDDRTIDVVINATPDHWHALPVVMACQAGKDVFVEKPVAVTVEEGKAMLAAARKHQRVVQVGLWQRSNVHFQEAAQIVRQGLLGRVSFVRTWNYSNASPNGIGSPPDSDPPPGLDWDMWLGPAPRVPFNANRFGVGEGWSTFRHFWDYSNGMLGDWAVHLVDIVQWALDTPGPVAVTGVGQKLAVKDNGDTPDTLQATFEYPGFVCTYENRQANANSMFGKGYGIEFHGTEATMFLNRSGFEVFPETRRVGETTRTGNRNEKDVPRSPSMRMDEVDEGLFNHAGNMLECVRTRKRPACDIEDGLRSSATCLLGVVALRTKERIEYDPVKLELKNASGAARRLFGREYRAPWRLSV
ncbi:MAG TPA: Gfo/Idh/MocA family oxidoreductase [Vicinamibacteria bacterium]|nr:Gfo/Idh/MocA family oxidoreductase [Vicinamibacteria bacterium]